MARALVILWAARRGDWQDKIRTLHRYGIDAHGTGDPKLRYWGLLEEDPEPRDDGGHAGWWRVTDQGGQFAMGALLVPKYALVYDGRLRGFDGPLVGVRECLGKR